MKKIKIGYFADGPWSHLAFEKIIKDNTIDVKFIVPRFDTTDNKLKQYALENNIDYIKTSNINSNEFLQEIKKNDCDLFVSMSFNQIFKEEIINMTPFKIINCHAGKLPFYRGRNILNWVLINDEKEFGITVHYVDKGIDTGDIILQKTFPITDLDTYNTLLDVAHIECANILFESIKMIQKGVIQPINQTTIDSIGMYCGKRSDGDELLDWNQSSREVFNFVRAICNPGPKAHTYLDGELIKINKVNYFEKIKKYKGKAGQVLCKSENQTFYVKTKDSFIEVLEYEGKLKVGFVLKNK
jgi:methionyl-tRNA formyltransferase